MIGERSREAPRKDRPRRLLLLLLLLLLLIPFALGGIAVELLQGAPKTCSLGTSPGNSLGISQGSSPGNSPGSSPGNSPAAFASPTEAVGGVQTAAAPTPSPSGSGGGGGQTQVGGLGFKITGGVGNLTPGLTTAIRVTLTNPNDVPIYVTALAVSVSADSTPPGCGSASNVQLTQSNASSADPITVPAGGSVTLTSAPRAPQITLLNLPGVNQDICKSKSFALNYTGSAHS